MRVLALLCMVALVGAVTGCAEDDPTLGVVEQAQFVASPSSIEFGDVNVGSSMASTVSLSGSAAGNEYTVETITSTCSDVSVNGIDLHTCGVICNTSAVDFPPFEIYNQQSFSQTASVYVAFSPSSRGYQRCFLTFSVTDPQIGSFNRIVSIEGTGVAPELTLVAPQSGALSYGGQRINTNSATQTFTVSNTGDVGSTLTVFPLTFNGNADDYIVTFDTSIALEDGVSRSGTIAFSPKTIGSQDAILTIASNDPLDSDEVIALSGTGTGAVASVVSPLAFGSTVVGVARPATMTVTNTGTAPLTIFGGTVTGANPADFIGTGPALPMTIAPGTSGDLFVQCRPSGVGSRSATVTIDTDADGTPQDPQVLMTCTGTKPDITLTPSPLPSFGNVAPGTPSQQTLRVSNASGADASLLTVSSLTVSGSHVGDFSLNPSAGFTVPVGAFQDVVITFTPGAFGARSASLAIVSDDQETGTINVGLSGTGSGPEITLISPASGTVGFGDVPVGTASGGQSVTVRNDGNANLSITGATLVGGDLGQFTLNGPGLPLTVTATSSATWTVTCAPTGVAGPRSTTVRIASSDASEPNTDVALTCNGTMGNLIVETPTVPVQLAATDVGSQSTPVVVTLRNSGAAALTLGTPTIAAPFSISTGLGTSSLGPGATTTLSVRFTPTVNGSVTGTLNVPFDGTSNLAVGLSGTGRAALVAVSSSSLSFDNVVVGSTATTRTFTIDNAGLATLNVSAANKSGSHPGDFVVVSPTFPTPVAAGGSVTVTVRCTPAAVAARSAILTLDTDADNTPQDPALVMSCNGVSPDIAVAPSSLTFGDVAPGTPSQLDVTVSNVASATASTLTVSAVAIVSGNTGDFSVSPSTPFTLAPGAERVLTVTFTPGALNARASTLRLTSDDPGSAITNIPLTGSGVATEITILQPAGATIAFGDVKVGVASTPATLQVRNDGNAELTVTNVVVTGAQSGNFQVSTPTAADIAAGLTASWTVTCLPTSTGDKAGTLAIHSNDADEAVKNLALTCRGTQPNLVLTSPSSPVTFASTRIGESSAQVTVVIENQGGAALTINGTPTVTGPFTITSALTDSTLDPGGGATLGMRFTPDSAGTVTGLLTIVWDANQLNIQLSGTGTTTVVTVDPVADGDGDIDLGAVCVGQPRAQRFTIQNSGTGPFQVLSVATDDAAFTATPVAPATYPATLGPNQTATFDLTVDPALGDVDASVTITTDMPVLPVHTLLVTASGLASGLGVAPAGGVAFPNTEPGDSSDPQIVTVTNCEAGAMTVSLAELQGGGADQFAIDTGPTLPVVVARADTAQWTVTFRPDDVGVAVATLHVEHDLAVGGGVIDVALTGQGGAGSPDAGVGPDAGEVDAGDDADAGTDPGFDKSSYYACSVGGPSLGTLLLLLGAIAAVTLRRRRRRPAA